MASGWGGSRPGAGKKPKPKPLGVVGVINAQTVDDPDDLCLPPTDLSTEQQDFWRSYAPLAVERNTLTPSTVPAFRLLCRLHAKMVLVESMVDKGALGGLRVFMQLAKQVESLMARFCLAPFGKPAKSEKVKPKDNPWASLANFK